MLQLYLVYRLLCIYLTYKQKYLLAIFQQTDYKIFTYLSFLQLTFRDFGNFF